MNVIMYLCFVVIVGAIGNNRKIGFWWSSFWALLLSPVIGLVITLLSKKK